MSLSGTNVSADILRFAGDVKVENVTITSMVSGLSFNVTNQVVTIEFFEDMFSPFMTGALILRESFDFANTLPIVGQEILDITVSTPTLEDSGGKISGKFYIYNQADSYDKMVQVGIKPGPDGNLYVKTNGEWKQVLTS